jgi:hypothetical protein
MRYGPGQYLPHRGVLGVQPAGRGQLTVTRLQPGRGRLGHLHRVVGQCHGGPVVLPDPGQQPRP